MTQQTKPTRKQLERIAILAGALRIEAPAKRASGSFVAQVPWVTLLKLEAALRSAGYDLDNARDALEEKKPRGRRGVGVRP